MAHTREGGVGRVRGEERRGRKAKVRVESGGLTESEVEARITIREGREGKEGRISRRQGGQSDTLP